MSRKTPINTSVSLGDYAFHVPTQAVGASLVYFDLFNASLYNVWLRALDAIKDGSVAITGVLGVNLFFTRTSAIGTGGTLAVKNDATLANGNITEMDTGRSLPTGITLRTAPSGGGTAGALISQRTIFGEETTGVNYSALSMLPPGVFLVPINTGIRVIQGAVAATGNIAFDGAFSLQSL